MSDSGRYGQCDGTCTADCGHCKGDPSVVIEDLRMQLAMKPVREIIPAVAIQLTDETDWEQIALLCGGQIDTCQYPSGEYVSTLTVPGNTEAATDGSWLVQHHNGSWTVYSEWSDVRVVPSVLQATPSSSQDHLNRGDQQTLNALYQARWNEWERLISEKASEKAISRAWGWLNGVLDAHEMLSVPYRLTREGIIMALARADGQVWESMADASYNTAEMMYGKQADAVLELFIQE